MSVNVTEYVNQLQQEGLSALKQSQDFTLSAFEKFKTIGREFSDKPGTLPTFEHVPTPAQFVELSFGFASQMLEIRKAYALKVAELIAEGQKQVEAGVKQAQTAVANGVQVAAKAPAGK